MTGAIKSLCQVDVRGQGAKELHITHLPNEVLQLIFFRVFNLRDCAWISQVSRRFKAIVWFPFEDFFKYSSQKIIANALAITKRAAISFEGKYKEEVEKLSKSWEIADLKKLEQACEARDALCVWQALQDTIFVNPDLSSLIKTRSEFSSWCDTHKVKLQNINIFYSCSGYSLVTLPNELWKLTGLRELQLVHNQLTSIPSQIESLSSLERLDLRHNQLTSIPSQIVNLKKLRDLNLTENPQLTNLPPEFENYSRYKLRYDKELNNSLVELGIIDDFDSLRDTWYCVGGSKAVTNLRKDKQLDQFEAIPVIGILGGLVRIIIGVALLAFNALKTVVFGTVALGAICLSNKKVVRVMRVALMDSSYAMLRSMSAILRGTFLTPVRCFMNFSDAKLF